MAQYSKRTIQSADDGSSANGWEYQFQTFFLGNYPPFGPYSAAVRFQDVNIVDGTVDSAFLTIRYDGSISQSGIDGPVQTGPVTIRIYGIAEDNTNDFTTSPLSRDRTTEFVDWTIPVTAGTPQSFTSPDLSAIIQEIIDRAGWDGNNAIGLILENNGSNRTASFMTYENVSQHRPLLVINYTGTTRTSRVIRPRARIYNPRQYGLKIVKPTFPLSTRDPSQIIFDSDYPTLKYFASGTVLVQNSEGCLGTYQVFNHNLGYFPYVEVFVKIPAVNNNFVPAPTFQLGAKVPFTYTFEITTTQIRFIIGNDFELEDEATFKYFIFRNDLGL